MSTKKNTKGYHMKAPYLQKSFMRFCFSKIQQKKVHLFLFLIFGPHLEIMNCQHDMIRHFKKKLKVSRN